MKAMSSNVCPEALVLDDAETVEKVNALFREWNPSLKLRPSCKDSTIGFGIFDEQRNLVSMGFLSSYFRTPSIDCPNGFVSELCGVYTSPQHRGKGYATLIVNKLIEFGEDMGVDYIHTDSYVSSASIYMKCGFIRQAYDECRLWKRNEQ